MEAVCEHCRYFGITHECYAEPIPVHRGHKDIACRHFVITHEAQDKQVKEKNESTRGK